MKFDTSEKYEQHSFIRSRTHQHRNNDRTYVVIRRLRLLLVSLSTKEAVFMDLLL